MKGSNVYYYILLAYPDIIFDWYFLFSYSNINVNLLSIICCKNVMDYFSYFLISFLFSMPKKFENKNRIIEYENKNKFSSIFIKKKKKKLKSYARIKCQFGYPMFYVLKFKKNRLKKKKQNENKIWIIGGTNRNIPISIAITPLNY